MSKREVIQSYIHGDLDRRGFVRALTALGISAGAAATYALQFAPSAIAGAGNGGFITRVAQQDAEYGTAIELEDDAQGIQILSDLLSDVADYFAAGLAQFDNPDFIAEDFLENTYSTLEDFISELNDHVDALAALGAVRFNSNIRGWAQAVPATAKEFTTRLSGAYDVRVSAMAAIVPAIQDGQSRQTLTNLSSVTSRQAGVINFLVDKDPTPSSFDEPVLPQ